MPRGPRSGDIEQLAALAHDAFRRKFNGRNWDKFRRFHEDKEDVQMAWIAAASAVKRGAFASLLSRCDQLFKDDSVSDRQKLIEVMSEIEQSIDL